jgi:HrpA-like RNA helicase
MAFVNMPISDSSKEQRIGRVGRLGDGMACLLYSEDYIFPPDISPMVINKNILDTLMKIMSL